MVWVEWKKEKHVIQSSVWDNFSVVAAMTVLDEPRDF